MTHMNDTIYKLKREYTNLLSRKNSVCLQYRTCDKSDAWTNVYYSAPNSAQTLGLATRIESLKSVDSELYAALAPILNDLMVKATDIKIATDEANAVKAARKEAQAAKTEQKAAVAKNPYCNLNITVANMLREIAVPYHAKAVKASIDRQTKFVSELKNRAAEVGSYDPRELYPSNSSLASRQQDAWKFINFEGSGRNATYSIVSNVDGIIQSSAKRAADDMVVAFVQKIGQKLSDLVERKGNVREVVLAGSLNDHWISVRFEDGSSFQVQTQIVWVINQNGTQFNRYPVNFRNVVLKDGSRMVLPSEAKMKKEFV